MIPVRIKLRNGALARTVSPLCQCDVRHLRTL